MKIGAKPENMFERLLMMAGFAPTPVVDTFHAVIIARGIMVATRLGIFEAVARGPLTAEEIASSIGAHPFALGKLLNLLVATNYLRHRSGRYAPTRMTRRWLLNEATNSLHDNILLRFLEWRAIESTEQFVRTGRALDVHERIENGDWAVYQRGMQSLSRFSAAEVARRTDLPADSEAMLDIGGGHGAYAAAFCRRHPRLRAIILDLPEAIEAAAPLLAQENMGERITHRTGDVRHVELGCEAYDLVFIAQLVHHFDAATNERLIERVAAALRPGGTLAIVDVLRPPAPTIRNQTGAILDLYFAVTSNSGTWSSETIGRWCVHAGLSPRSVLALQTAPGVSLTMATKGARARR